MLWSAAVAAAEDGKEQQGRKWLVLYEVPTKIFFVGAWPQWRRVRRAGFDGSAHFDRDNNSHVKEQSREECEVMVRAWDALTAQDLAGSADVARRRASEPPPSIALKRKEALTQEKEAEKEAARAVAAAKREAKKKAAAAAAAAEKKAAADAAAAKKAAAAAAAGGGGAKGGGGGGTGGRGDSKGGGGGEGSVAEMAAALAKSQAAAAAATAAAEAATAQLRAMQAGTAATQVAPAAGCVTPGPSQQHATSESWDSPPSAVRHLKGRLRGLRRIVARTDAHEIEIGQLEVELEERERKFRKHGHW